MLVLMSMWCVLKVLVGVFCVCYAVASVRRRSTRIVRWTFLRGIWNCLVLCWFSVGWCFLWEWYMWCCLFWCIWNVWCSLVNVFFCLIVCWVCKSLNFGFLMFNCMCCVWDDCGVWMSWMGMMMLCCWCWVGFVGVWCVCARRELRFDSGDVERLAWMLVG